MPYNCIALCIFTYLSYLTLLRRNVSCFLDLIVSLRNSLQTNQPNIIDIVLKFCNIENRPSGLRFIKSGPMEWGPHSRK